MRSGLFSSPKKEVIRRLRVGAYVHGSLGGIIAVNALRSQLGMLDRRMVKLLIVVHPAVKVPLRPRLTGSIAAPVVIPMAVFPLGKLPGHKGTRRSRIMPQRKAVSGFKGGSFQNHISLYCLQEIPPFCASGYFDKYCYEHCPEQTELTKEVVRGWFYDEIASGRACLSSKATTIRLFAKYLGSSAYVLPMNCVPKTPDYLPYILTDEELAALFQAADTMEYKNDPFFQKTASTLLRLLYACGLRPNEGRNLKVEHINFQTGELFITKTKRRKERIVVASGDMLLLLKKYRLQRAVFDKGNEYFFIHTDSTPVKSWQLTDLVKSCWIAAHPGIDPILYNQLLMSEKLYPHLIEIDRTTQERTGNDRDLTVTETGEIQQRCRELLEKCRET